MVPQIEDYKEHLAVLLTTFRQEPDLGYTTREEFTDEFGNAIELSAGLSWWFVAPIIQLLKTNETGYIEIRDLDRGHISFQLLKFSDSYYMLSQLKVNTDIVGKFDSFVVLRNLEPLIELLEQCKER